MTSCATTKRKIVRRGVPMGLPTRATHRNQVWTWAFSAEATVRGGALKWLTILDEYTRAGPVLWAERVCGKLPRAVSGRMFEPRTTVDVDGSAGSRGRLPTEIQSDKAAQPAGLRSPSGVCGAARSIPSSIRASPSRRWGRTKNQQKHNLNDVPGLTHAGH